MLDKEVEAYFRATRATDKSRLDKVMLSRRKIPSAKFFSEGSKTLYSKSTYDEHKLLRQTNRVNHKFEP